MCKRPEPKQTNYMCHNCGISLHTGNVRSLTSVTYSLKYQTYEGCYGISEETERADFLCDLCRPDINENRRVVSLKMAFVSYRLGDEVLINLQKPACSVCPPSSALASTPISALDALKRTDGAG